MIETDTLSKGVFARIRDRYTDIEQEGKESATGKETEIYRERERESSQTNTDYTVDI